MYIQITTKCTMSCPHCCYSCEVGKGEHMPKDLWKKALEVMANSEDHLEIGGGEPTLHPDFRDILLEGIASFEYVWLATNGTNKKEAMLLNKLAKAKVIGAELSWDRYHETHKVDMEVYQAFEERNALRSGDEVSRWLGDQYDHIAVDYWPEFVPQAHREYANGGRNGMSKTMREFAITYNQCRKHCSPLCCFKTTWPMVKCLSFTAAPTGISARCLQGWL